MTVPAAQTNLLSLLKYFQNDDWKAKPIMCGIVGLIDTIEGRVAPRLLESMRDLMIARGPDDTGDYFDGPVGMAMRRLSIIDIETGSQPFFSRGDEIVAFQNGEI